MDYAVIALLSLALGVWLGYLAGYSAPEAEGVPETPAAVPPTPGEVYRPVLDSLDELRREARAGQRRVRVEPWKVEFRSGSGRRVLGREVRQDRRVPTITYVGMDGLRGSFTCDTQKPDGTWVYRRVSVER